MLNLITKKLLNNLPLKKNKKSIKKYQLHYRVIKWKKKERSDPEGATSPRNLKTHK